MRNRLITILFLALSISALALEDSQVMYVGGTVNGLSAGAMGKLDTTSDTALIFASAGNQLAMPYITMGFEYSREVKHHLGVLPAIGIGLLTKRRRSHFFRISYRDSNNVQQVAVFEVSKRTPRTLKAVLQTRAPRPCRVGPQMCHNGVPTQEGQTNHSEKSVESFSRESIAAPEIP